MSSKHTPHMDDRTKTKIAHNKRSTDIKIKMLYIYIFRKEILNLFCKVFIPLISSNYFVPTFIPYYSCVLYNSQPCILQ